MTNSKNQIKTNELKMNNYKNSHENKQIKRIDEYEHTQGVTKKLLDKYKTGRGLKIIDSRNKIIQQKKAA